MYDVHTHFIPPLMSQWLYENRSVVNAAWVRKSLGKAPFLTINGNWEFELKEAFTDSDLYLTGQRKAGIAHSLVSPIPQLFLYEMAPDVTEEAARIYNDGLADWSAAHRDEVSALATVPMNDPDRAARELERAMDLGLRGAIVASSWGGRTLGEEAFTPFWEVANTREAIVFIHPLLCTDSRLKKHMMPNLIGVPWETTVCATELLLSGLVFRYPKVKLLLAHGGGYFPYQLGRLEKGYETWGAVSAGLPESPTEAARRFWYDTVLWNDAALQYLIDIAGEDRIVQGTDAPFDLCQRPPAAVPSSGYHALMEV
ncbi:amidohydrolase family protein [Paenibacillus sp.]|uniref:amidohydrolase family protein n=1 Tax=Paenibacillus sp. TaxID=58172 RepID=UPI002D759DCA|nr:amidohydrolase family protein [Paenibacillus sp.]HZG84061.1 amidohydrolase family protein [Paenibacillus sp.]